MSALVMALLSAGQRVSSGISIVTVACKMKVSDSLPMLNYGALS